jgi:hypothetical protein
VVDAFGKTQLVDDLASDDFEALRATLAKRLNPNSLGNDLLRIHVAFNYALDSGMIEKPVKFGPHLKRPAKRILRAERQKKGPRAFQARHLRRMLKAADQPLKAMILLGITCGFGNHDCGTLPQSALDLKAGWSNFRGPRRRWSGAAHYGRRQSRP